MMLRNGRQVMAENAISKLQVCLNGHVVNRMVDFLTGGHRTLGDALDNPGGRFCDVCGEKLTAQCASCRTEIPAPLYWDWAKHDYPPPAFCRHCGAMHPWTERKLRAAHELVDGDQTLAADEKAAFDLDIKDIAGNVPRTQAAAIRIKGFLAKIPGAVGSALRDIAVDVASDAAKKIILGP